MLIADIGAEVERVERVERVGSGGGKQTTKPDDVFINRNRRQV